MKAIIVIPARINSERLPNKPLIKIKGKEMLLRVVEIAEYVKNKRTEIEDVIVATDSNIIQSFCDKNEIKSIIIKQDCSCGSERVWYTLKELNLTPDFVLNFQGDNPLCPPWFLEKLLDDFLIGLNIEIISPCVRLSWNELDKMREIKKKSPFSGTTVVFNKRKDAIWFSKQILPAIRNENQVRKELSKSPVYKHIGVYGYSYNILRKIENLKQSNYMKWEGLEQFLFIENGIKIKLSEVDYQGRGESMPGINTIHLIKEAEKIIDMYGELIM